MDFTNFIGNSPFSFLLPQAGDPTSSAPNAPTNILPPQAQTAPTQPMAAGPARGILNGAQNPMDMMKQAQQLMGGGQQQQTPQMQPIQFARPVGAQGIDPTKLLAAMQANKLMSI